MSGPGLTLDLAWVGAVFGPLVALLAWRLLGDRRRRWAVTRVALVVFALAYALAVWAFLIEPRTLVMRRVTVESAQWSGPPLRIAAISDTHIGAHVTPERVRRTMARLNRERPDVVVFLGDYAGGHEPADVRARPDRSAVLQGAAALG